MSAHDLKLQVLLRAVDRATRPIKSVRDGSVGLARQLKETRDTLKALQAQQKDVGSFRTLRTAAEQTGAAMAANRERLRQLSRELANTANPTRQLTRDFQRAAREGSALKQKHSEQQRALLELRGRLGAAGISTRNLGQHERELRQRIRLTNQALSQQELRLKRVAVQQKRLAQAKADFERSRQRAGGMAAIGAAHAAGGAGALYLGGRMLAPGAQFDADMSRVQALTRMQKSDPRLAALRKQARVLGAETMFSATDAAQGQAYLAMAGFSPQSILDAMPGMLSVAKAGDTELGETADIASNILSGFALQASQMPRVADVLVGTFTRSNTTLAMLGDTMKYAAPIAASLSQDIETVAAMAGKLGDAGIQGSMGGTALRAILNRLSAPPKAAAKALDKLGISAADARGNLRPMPELLREIYQRTKNMGDTQRAGLLKGIAGEEAVSALSVLVNQAGSGELQKFIATLRQAQGEAAQTAGIMGDNLVGSLDELSSAWEDLGIELFDQQDGPLRQLVVMLTDIVGAISGWVQRHPRLSAALVVGAAAVAILVAGLGALTVIMASILGPLAMVRLGMALLGVATTTALWPVLAVIAAVAALAAAAYLIYQNWEPIKAFFGGVWDSIKAAFESAWEWLSALPAKFLDLGGRIIDGMVSGITNALGRVKQAVVGAGEGAINWFKETLGIRSPSRIFAALGGETMAGLAQGIARRQQGPLAAVAGVGRRLATAAAGALALGAAGGALAIDNRPPLAAAGASVHVAGDTVHITIQAGAQDSGELARLINRMLDERERHKAARIRSALYDRD